MIHVTEHAVERYAEHVRRLARVRLSPQEAMREICEALDTGPLFTCRSARGEVLLGLRNRHGWTFIAACGAEAREVATVGPCWYWHEARPYYRKMMASRRHWRARA